nr:hypothetical protein [Streptomyces cahuitamycinicus]
MDLTCGPATYFLPHHLSGLGVLGMGEGLVAGPAAGMPGDDFAAGGEHDDLLVVGQHGDLVADRGGFTEWSQVSTRT